ncbi:MAG: exodeoxyribonuclease VII large subunit [Hyphomonas sp.]|nr:exodeoxyribonuclease VII large subunit [Hyphomonas sp.]
MSDTAPSNDHAQSVSELAASLKRTIETNYDHVVVRGELGRVTIAKSGHMYADLKDEKAVLNTIMWRGQVERLSFRPEEGLEVIATGRLSTYEGRSAYQLIASSMRPAGAGALMQLLEERKKKLAAEGLFDARHKKPIPYMPRVVGVVTSPTGAVIRDILHRIRERFPVRVIVWPALVQGEQAAAQVTAGIRGFNAMTGADRPDVLIVARGGGSIEDLWPFNEEIVVRAAFDSEIPLISAVGHETDTTLIDYVSDRRAPTPTGAAEMAVPVRTELLLSTGESGERLKRALARALTRSRDKLAAARLPRPEMLLQPARQRLDFASANLPRAALALTQKARLKLSRLQLSPALLKSEIRVSRQRLRDIAVRARPALMRLIEKRAAALNGEAKMLETLSYQATLKRGYAIVRDTDGRLIRSAEIASGTDQFKVSFADGDVAASPLGSTPKPKAPPRKPGQQGSLF